MDNILAWIIVFTGALATISAIVGVSSILTVSRFKSRARRLGQMYNNIPSDTPNSIKNRIWMNYEYELKNLSMGIQDNAGLNLERLTAKNISINTIPRKSIDAKARSIVPGPDREEVSNEPDNAQQMDQ